MNKKLVLIGVFLALAAAASYGVYGYLQKGVVSVQTDRVVRRDLVAIVTASGEIKPRNYINIGANSMGRITEIYVSEGDGVRKGQLLAKLETVQPAAEVAAQKANQELARSELAAAEAAVEANDAHRKTQQASLKRAQAELERAKVNFNRASQLLEDRLIARQDYDQRKADLEAARAVVEEAKAVLAELEVQRERLLAQRESARSRVAQAAAHLRRAADVLDKHHAISPIDGVVTNLPVRVGETVVPGIQNSPASLIMTIADMSLITAEVKVDETDIVSVRLGQTADVSIDASPDQAFRGGVIEIGNTAILRTTGLAASQSTVASQEAKDFKVVVALDDPPPTIRPGMSSTARITTASVKETLAVPIQAVTVRMRSDVEAEPEAGSARAASEEGNPKQEVEGVFVVVDGKAEFRPLRTGIMGSSYIEVVEGLKEAEEIISGSYQVLRTIRSGTKVTIENSGRSI